MKDPDLARLFENTFPNTLGEYPSVFEYQGSEDVQILPSSISTK